jgi:regulator of sigma E protease
MRSLYTLFAVGVLVALHELGHLLAARLLRIDVEQVTLGMGPPLLSWRWGRTRWALGPIPLGATVRLVGSNPHQAGPPAPRGYLSQPTWRRALVLLAGPLTNYFLALGLLVFLYTQGTHVPVNLTIGSVEPGSAAARAGLRPGDGVTALNGTPLLSWSDLVEQVAQRPGSSLHLTIVRLEGPTTVWVEPRPDSVGLGRLGIGQQYTFRRQDWGPAMLQALTHTRVLALDGLALTARLLRGEGHASDSVPAELLRRTDGGLDGWVRMGVGLSLALTAFYLLPFPALDGGKLVLIGLERLRGGRKLSPWAETMLQVVFFSLLGVALLYITLLRRLHGR